MKGNMSIAITLKTIAINVLALIAIVFNVIFN